MTVRKTSIKAYQNLVDSGALAEKKREVYKVIYDYGPVTGSQVKKIMNKTNQLSESIRNRITELVAHGVVEEIGSVKCQFTGRDVLLYDVTDQENPRPYTKTTKYQRKVEALRLLEMYGEDFSNSFKYDNLKKAIETI